MKTTNDLGKYAVELQQKIDQLSDLDKCAVLGFIQRGERVREGMSPRALEHISAFLYSDVIHVEIIYSGKDTTMNGYYYINDAPIASVKREKGDEVNHAASIASLLETMAKHIRKREYDHNGPGNGDPCEQIPVQLSR